MRLFLIILLSLSEEIMLGNPTILKAIELLLSTLDPESGAQIGIRKDDGTLHNPSGFSGNLLKILPDIISIPATADTVQELADKSTLKPQMLMWI